MYSVNDIKNYLGDEVKYFGNENANFDKVSNLDDADGTSLVWIKKINEDFFETLNNSKASIIVCPEFDIENGDVFQNKFLVLAVNPKLVFIRLAEKFFVRKISAHIHNSAVIDSEAILGKNVYIGPNTVIEKCIIGENCVIHGNCYIFSGTRIGNGVKIFPGTVIGSDGFGYTRSGNGKLEKFPHFGGVEISDEVEIGSNTSIDRGTLGNTVIEEGVKIDNLVHVAHNVFIGKHSMVIANSMIGGSTKIGAYSWIAPSVNLMNQIVIGKNVTIGMGSVVTKNVPDNETWTGIPAKEFKEFLELQKKLKNL